MSFARSCLVTALLLMVFAAGGAHADDDVVETQTVSGHKVVLIQVGQGDYRVRVDGKEVLASGPPKAEMELEGVHQGDNKTYVVFDTTIAGACTVRLLALDLSGPAPRASGPMARCDTTKTVSVIDGVLTIHFTTPDGQTGTDTFADGVTHVSPLEPPPVLVASKPLHPVRCDSDAVRDAAIGTVKNLLETGEAGQLSQFAPLFPNAKMEWKELGMTDFGAVTDEPMVLSSDAAVDHMPSDIGGLLYDGGRKSGAIDTSNLTLCKADVTFSLTLREASPTQPKEDPITQMAAAPVRFIAQSAPSGDDNIIVYGLTQGELSAICGHLATSLAIKLVCMSEQALMHPRHVR